MPPAVDDDAVGKDVAQNFLAFTAGPVEDDKRWLYLRYIFGDATPAQFALALRKIKHPFDQARFLLLLQAFSPEIFEDVLNRVDAKTALELITKHLIVIDRDGQLVTLSFKGSTDGIDDLPAKQPDEVIAWACLNTLLEAKGLCGVDWKGAQLALITESTTDVTTPASKRSYHASSGGVVISAHLEYIDGVVSHQIVIHISGGAAAGHQDEVSVEEEIPSEDLAPSSQPPTAPTPDDLRDDEDDEMIVRALLDMGVDYYVAASLGATINARRFFETSEDVDPDVDIDDDEEE